MLKKRIRFGLALSLWIGLIMFGGSLFFAAMLEKNLKKLYFTESYLFYEIIVILIFVFIAGFIFCGKENESGKTRDVI